MKHQLTKLQYIQLAKEAFTKLISKIPFVSDIEILVIKRNVEIGDFHAVVHFSDTDRVQDFFIEVKANGEKRFAAIFASQAVNRKDNACYMLIAPYISEATAEFLGENNLSFMDLSGNCSIVTKRIFVSVSGKPNRYVEQREKKNYLSKSASAASAIIRTMLNEPEKLWKVKELSEETGKAIGSVSNVKSFLNERDWIDDQKHSFRLKNISELLHVWSKDYHKSDSIVKEYYSLLSIPELEKRISEWSIAHDQSAVLSNFSAAARYAPTVNYNRVNVYVEDWALYEFVKDIALEPVRSGGNIIVTIPHDNTPCMFSRVIRNSVVASPVQTVIDLLEMPNRGQEAAEAIISKEFKR